jgi:hypothetical protein
MRGDEVMSVSYEDIYVELCRDFKAFFYRAIEHTIEVHGFFAFEILEDRNYFSDETVEVFGISGDECERDSGETADENVAYLFVQFGFSYDYPDPPNLEHMDFEIQVFLLPEMNGYYTEKLDDFVKFVVGVELVMPPCNLEELIAARDWFRGYSTHISLVHA